MSLADFLSTVRTEGLSKANRYSVLISPPAGIADSNSDLSRVSLFAESTELPGVTVKTEKLKIYGPEYIRPTGIDYGQTVNVTFLVDRDFRVRKLFEDWINMVVDKNSYNISYQILYISNQIRFIQLDTQDEERYSITLKEAFPVSIEIMPISYSSDGIHRISVTFAFRRWESMFGSVAETEPREYPQTKKDYISATPLQDAIQEFKNPSTNTIKPYIANNPKPYSYSVSPIKGGGGTFGGGGASGTF